MSGTLCTTSPFPTSSETSHPSLRVKRIQGTKNRREGSIAMKYRFTFQFLENGLIFRAIGTHDILDGESQ
ncbi:MAG: hypothetical protein C4B57_01365 [Deltaproteobacteria bacterium]|nr:MAG: hypothetical protein C4B57_01365 [Deltaproteobacteria bacterium]